MKRLLLGILFYSVTLVAEITNTPATIDLVESSEIKIIDIRTESEWEKLGVVKDAYLITFFNEKSKYDIDDFLKKLNRVIEKDETFGIISNNGSRTKLIANLLGNKLKYNVINLTGGIKKLRKEGYKVIKYPSCKVLKVASPKEGSKNTVSKKSVSKKAISHKASSPKFLLSSNKEDNNTTK